MMTYGPDWPPRPATPRRRPVRRGGLSIAEQAAYGALVAVLMMLCCMVLWTQTSIPLDLPAGPHTTDATTNAGSPVAGHGQPRHRSPR